MNDDLAEQNYPKVTPLLPPSNFEGIIPRPTADDVANWNEYCSELFNKCPGMRDRVFSWTQQRFFSERINVLCCVSAVFHHLHLKVGYRPFLELIDKKDGLCKFLDEIEYYEREIYGPLHSKTMCRTQNRQFRSFESMRRKVFAIAEKGIEMCEMMKEKINRPLVDCLKKTKIINVEETRSKRRGMIIHPRFNSIVKDENDKYCYELDMFEGPRWKNEGVWENNTWTSDVDPNACRTGRWGNLDDNRKRVYTHNWVPKQLVSVIKPQNIDSCPFMISFPEGALKFNEHSHVYKSMIEFEKREPEILNLVSKELPHMLELYLMKYQEVEKINTTEPLVAKIIEDNMLRREMDATVLANEQVKWHKKMEKLEQKRLECDVIVASKDTEIKQMREANEKRANCLQSLLKEKEDKIMELAKKNKELDKYRRLICQMQGLKVEEGEI